MYRYRCVVKVYSPVDSEITPLFTLVNAYPALDYGILTLHTLFPKIFCGKNANVVSESYCLSFLLYCSYCFPNLATIC